jgi:hypothetical protein
MTEQAQEIWDAFCGELIDNGVKDSEGRHLKNRHIVSCGMVCGMLYYERTTNELK